MDLISLKLALNTAILAGITCLVSLPVGVGLAWLLVRTDLPRRKAALGLLAVMLFVPLYVQAAAWQAGFGMQGWYTLAYAGPAWLDGWTGAIWVHVMAALPWVVLIVAAGLWLVEPELEESALLDGTSGQVLRHVTLPSTATAVGVAALWVLTFTAGEMTVTDLFAVRTYAEEIYTRLAIGQQPGEASLGVLPGAVLTVLLVVAGLGVSAKLAGLDRPLSFRPRWVFRLGRWRIAATVAVALVLLLLAGVPLVNLAYKAGVEVTQNDAGRLRSWSLWKCLSIVGTSPWRYQREFGWSLALGTLAASAAVTIGTLLAWFARQRRLGAGLALLVTALSLAIPGPLVGLAIIGLLNRPELPPLVYLYDQSLLAPWLALTFRGLAPATLVMWHALRTLPQEMLDSAKLDGAGSLYQLGRIALPSRLTAVAVAWLVALAIVLGDLAASILVVPPGVITLPIRIFGLMHYGVEDQVAGICLVLVAVFAVVAAGAIRLGAAKDLFRK
jgi:iron(III) transport system permease protein